jgi:hypothetical protein
MKKGDYVLATKYSDGDPKDHFAIGFFHGMLIDNNGKETERFMVVDASGKNFRGNGFRRCERITQRTGKILCDGISIMEQSCRSIWYWRRHLKELAKLEGK